MKMVFIRLALSLYSWGYATDSVRFMLFATSFRVSEFERIRLFSLR